MDIRRISTTLKAATNRNLTTVALFKSIINKTEIDQNGYLAWAVAAASAQVESYCNLVFAQESILDLFRISQGGGSSFGSGPNDLVWNDVSSSRGTALVLSRKPVANVWAIVDSTCQATTLSAPMDASQTTMACVVALPTTYPFNVVIGTGANSEVMTVLGFGSGNYTVTRAVNGNAKAHATGVDIAVALDPATYEVDMDAAIVWRLRSVNSPVGWHGGAVYVFVTTGYTLPAAATPGALPFDIEDATIRLMRYMWSTKDRDPTLRSEGEPGLGNKVYWVGMPGGSNLPPDVEAILDNYRDRQFA